VPTVAGTAEGRWRAIAKAQLAQARVSEGTGFGQTAGLRVSGRIFAMFMDDRLVVKLPKDRVDELVASGAGRRFDPGHGRVMKEWIAVDPTAIKKWSSLATEARGFVAAQRAPKRKAR
jgi:hypothetical protein